MFVAFQKRVRRSQHARKETEFLRLKRTRLGLDDFESLKVIGRGAFGEVIMIMSADDTLMKLCVCVIHYTNVFLMSTGASSSEERHRSRLRHEDPSQSRHAAERAGDN